MCTINIYKYIQTHTTDTTKMHYTIGRIRTRVHFLHIRIFFLPLIVPLLFHYEISISCSLCVVVIVRKTLLLSERNVAVLLQYAISLHTRYEREDHMEVSARGKCVRMVQIRNFHCSLNRIRIVEETKRGDVA